MAETTLPVLVHIGYFKTASTWLQRHVFGRSDRGFFPLAPDRVTDPMKACKYLSRAFLRGRKGYPLTPFEQGHEWLEGLMGKIDLTRAGQPVISNERLSGYPMAGGYDAQALCQRIHHAFPDAKILIVIRNQHEMIRSCYVQYLRRGGTESLRQMLRPYKDTRLPRFTPDVFMYHDLIKGYQDRFGGDSVLVLPYEMFTSNPQNFVDAIYQFCGITADYDFAFGQIENQSSLNYVEYKTRFLNKFAMRTTLNSFSSHYSETRRDYVHSLRQHLDRWVPEEKKKKHEGKMKKIIRKFVPEDFYAASNTLTSSLIDMDLSAFGYAMGHGHSDQSKANSGARPLKLSA